MICPLKICFCPRTGMSDGNHGLYLAGHKRRLCRTRACLWHSGDAVHDPCGVFSLASLSGQHPGWPVQWPWPFRCPSLSRPSGYTPDALLPVLGFLVGVMKGATLGGAVPAILFNTPGTPDAYMTTLDGHPMAKAGQPGRALRIAPYLLCHRGHVFRRGADSLRPVPGHSGRALSGPARGRPRC